MYSPRKRLRGTLAATCATAAALCLLVVGSAQAAPSIYPQGGGAFNKAGPELSEGWSAPKAECKLLGLLGVELLCTPEGVYDEAGATLEAKTSPGLELLSLLFESKIVLQSPAFEVAGSGIATLHLDREFNPGGVIALNPTGTYSVVLEDVDSGTVSTVKHENLGEETPMGSTEAGGINVVGGHTYVIRIETEVGATLSVGLEILAPAPAVFKFDNVYLSVPSAGEPGSPGSPGKPGSPGAPGSPGTPGNGGNGNNGGNGANGHNGHNGANGSGAHVSAGVRIVRGPLSGGAIARIARSVNVGAEVGHGPGGSLIPLSQCTIIGTPHRDVITATRGNDVICGLGGRDVIRGAGGRDVIDGGNGNDVLIGGAGADVIIGLRGVDTERGGRGNDRLGGGANGDRLYGGAGDDLLIGRRGVNRLYGGSGDDRLISLNRRRDRVRGGSGADVAIIDRRDRKSVRSARVRMHRERATR